MKVFLSWTQMMGYTEIRELYWDIPAAKIYFFLISPASVSSFLFVTVLELLLVCHLC